jgi:hypothetical protein
MNTATLLSVISVMAPRSATDRHGKCSLTRKLTKREATMVFNLLSDANRFPTFPVQPWGSGHAMYAIWWTTAPKRRPKRQYNTKPYSSFDRTPTPTPTPAPTPSALSDLDVQGSTLLDFDDERRRIAPDSCYRTEDDGSCWLVHLTRDQAQLLDSWLTFNTAYYCSSPVPPPNGESHKWSVRVSPDNA